MLSVILLIMILSFILIRRIDFKLVITGATITSTIIQLQTDLIFALGVLFTIAA